MRIVMNLDVGSAGWLLPDRPRHPNSRVQFARDYCPTRSCNKIDVRIQLSIRPSGYVIVGPMGRMLPSERTIVGACIAATIKVVALPPVGMENCDEKLQLPAPPPKAGNPA